MASPTWNFRQKIEPKAYGWLMEQGWSWRSRVLTRRGEFSSHVAESRRSAGIEMGFKYRQKHIISLTTKSLLIIHIYSVRQKLRFQQYTEY
jgi:hypothetical protein